VHVRVLFHNMRMLFRSKPYFLSIFVNGFKDYIHNGDNALDVLNIILAETSLNLND